MLIRKNTHYTEKVRSGKSLPPLRGLLIFECPVDILINRSLPPVHKATGGHAVRTFRPVILLGVTMRIDINAKGEMTMTVNLNSLHIDSVSKTYPKATSRIIMREKPKANIRVPILECRPPDISGMSSSTTT